MLNTAEQEAWDFLSKAPHYPDPDQVELHFGRALAAFGYDRFCATLINAEQLGREPPPSAAATSTNGTPATGANATWSTTRASPC